MQDPAFPFPVDYGQLAGALAFLFLVSVLYAILLELSERRWNFVSDYTWLTVVIGVAYTLAAVAAVHWPAALLALICFAVSSLPIVARAIINDVAARRELRDYLRRQGSGDDGA